MNVEPHERRRSPRGGEAVEERRDGVGVGVDGAIADDGGILALSSSVSERGLYEMHRSACHRGRRAGPPLSAEATPSKKRCSGREIVINQYQGANRVLSSQ